MNKKTANIITGLIFIAVAFFVLRGCFGGEEKAEPVTREKRIEQLFSPLDGSHDGTTEWLKSQLNDPSSLEILEVRYIDRKDSISVITDFTAKNEFGGRVRGTCISQIDTNGSLKSATVN